MTPGEGAGRVKRALVVGGWTTLVEDSLGPLLSQYGLEVAEHWDMDRTVTQAKKGVVPSGIEVVVMLVDSMPQGHTFGPALREAASAVGAVVVAGSRKKALLADALRRAGFQPGAYTPAAEVRQPLRAPMPKLELPKPAVVPRPVPKPELVAVKPASAPAPPATPDKDPGLCVEVGCVLPKQGAQEVCKRHYHSRWAASRPRCSVGDCGRPGTRAGGICVPHAREAEEQRKLAARPPAPAVAGLLSAVPDADWRAFVSGCSLLGVAPEAQLADFVSRWVGELRQKLKPAQVKP